MISPSSSSTRRNTPCVAGCDGPMLSTIFSPISLPSGCKAASAATTRVTGSGDSISRVVKAIKRAGFMLASGNPGASVISHSVRLFRKHCHCCMKVDNGALKQNVGTRVPKTLAAALLLTVVATPSLWMFATLPPLWRDVDAYVQTVYPPSPDTILLHGPLYCAVSRIPLWLGYLATGSGPLVSLGRFIDHSQLTDAGVFGLIFAQHAALW